MVFIERPALQSHDYLFLEGLLICLVGAFALIYWRKSLVVMDAKTVEIDDLAFSRIAVTHADDGLLVLDMNGVIQWVNPAYCRIMGYDSSELIGRNPLGFALLKEETPDADAICAFRFNPDDPAQHGLHLYQNRRKNGQVFWNQINTSFHTTVSGVQYAVLVCRDVTANIQREKQLEATSRELAHIAAHDELTGAANRATLTKFLDVALQRARANASRVGVLHVDLDKFKHINDSHGHSAGDAILIAAVKRIKSHIRETDLLARVGGDEFVVVCQDLHSLSDLQSIGATLTAAVNQTVRWQNMNLQCQISIGAALSCDQTCSADDLLQQSDFALYEVKRTGRGRVMAYNRALHARHMRDIQIAADLRLAITSNLISFDFQPILDVQRGAIYAVETLPRWDHTREGSIPPSEFLAIAHAIGLSASIDFQALEAALDMKNTLNDAGFPDIKVSVNAASDTLAHTDFLPRLTEGLRARGLRAGQIIVEVPEAVIFEIEQGRTDIAQTLEALRSFGIATLLDDLGGGQTGMTYLSRLTMSGVKIDASLTQSFLEDAKIDRIVATLISLCRELDLMVITEGVDTQDQANHLAELGATALQGCWVTPPLEATMLIEWLHARTDCPRLSPPLSRGQLIA